MVGLMGAGLGRRLWAPKPHSKVDNGESADALAGGLATRRIARNSARGDEAAKWENPEQRVERGIEL